MAIPEPERARQPHDYGSERAGRLEKAAKIRRLIERRRPFTGATVLEVGCGSGWMATEWARLAGPSGSVAAVDRVDQRRSNDGYDFTRVSGTSLPFAPHRFDIVISNHVMEHVGTRTDQRDHLRELGRVLAPGGVVYLAVPNRWRLVEPHFHLPLLSWLPQSISDAYVRAVGRGTWYDVVPPSLRDMRRLLDEAGFAWEDVTLPSIEIMRETESLSRAEALVATAPRRVLELGHWFMPSLLFLLADS